MSDDRLTDRDVVEHCLRHHAPFKKPRHVIFVDELPKNSLGKILKRELVRSLGRGKEVSGAN